MVVAAKLVFDSVYDDLIFWRKGNLATRPVGGGQVWLAKFLFLFLFLAGPFALAAVVYLGLMGMPGTVVLLGAAQSLIQSFAAILLLIPLFLLWRFSQLAALALVLAALATGAFHFLPQLISRSIPTKSVPYPAVPEASVPSFEMAELSITTTFVENEPHLAFSLVPSLPVPVARDVVWAFASARLGQKPLSMKSPCKAG
ncbi:MAG TPA: hypothetical protein VJ952_02540, partial [Opitutales bacterium]|nr:hypothetical protein [Opitutales bacterium]